jgi:ABC-type dipeptide/oligopeptide/nickel transport system permease subunit
MTGVVLHEAAGCGLSWFFSLTFLGDGLRNALDPRMRKD